MLFKQSKKQRSRKPARRLGGEFLENRNLMTGLSLASAPDVPPPESPHLVPILEAPHQSEAGDSDRARDDADLRDCLTHIV